MDNKQTIELLRSCDAGLKTAVNCMEELVDRAKAPELEELLTDYLEQNERLGNEVHSALQRAGGREKDPSTMARMMAWGKINMMYALHPSDETVADLTSEGCAMGIKSVSHSRNRCAQADEEAQKLAGRVVECEQALLEKLNPFL